MTRKEFFPFSTTETAAPFPSVFNSFIGLGNFVNRFVPGGIVSPVCATDIIFAPGKTQDNFFISSFTSFILSYTSPRLASSVIRECLQRIMHSQMQIWIKLQVLKQDIL